MPCPPIRGVLDERIERCRKRPATCGSQPLRRRRSEPQIWARLGHRHLDNWNTIGQVMQPTKFEERSAACEFALHRGPRCRSITAGESGSQPIHPVFTSSLSQEVSVNPPLPSKRHRWTGPRVWQWPGAGQGFMSGAPAITAVSAWAPAPQVQHRLALGVEVEEPQDIAALLVARRLIAADKLVV